MITKIISFLLDILDLLSLTRNLTLYRQLLKTSFQKTELGNVENCMLT